MSPFSIIPAITIVLLALATISLLNRFFTMAPPAQGRYAAIDGLRGYLAFLVFIHHAAVWYCQLHYHRWMKPPSWLYSHFGPTSVFFFFMITAFLFFTKLINAREKGIDWPRLYLGRAFRIMPLYLFAMLVLFYIAGYLSHFTLQQPLFTVVKQLLGWVGFMSPDINRVNQTWVIIAGVTWSLSYEWMFYFSLPFWGLLFGIRTRIITLLLCALCLVAFAFIIYYFYKHGVWKNFSPFLGGIATAFIVRNKKIQQLAASYYMSFVIVVLLVVVVLFYSSSFSLVPYLCNWIVFTAIAGGNTLFGLLTHKASFLLGQVSYSLYLLHGMLLFALFNFLPGLLPFAMQSAVTYWLVIAVAGILLTILCTITYHYIEQPGIDAIHAVSKKKNTYRTAGAPAP